MPLLCLSGCGTACLHCTLGLRLDPVLDVGIAVTAPLAVVCVVLGRQLSMAPPPGAPSSTWSLLFLAVVCGMLA